VARSPGRIARFAGLGAIGGRRKDRAAMLHSAGFGPAPVELRAGMLDLEWHEGRPVEKPTDDLIARGAEYLAFIRSNCATGGVDDMDELRSMIATNVAEAGLIADADAAAHAASAATRRVAIDGRMMLHEWIDTSTGLMKVDALDHHDDDFFPGCRDIAWDVAGACVEWNLDADGVDRFVSAYRRASHDMDIERRLPFYEAAYAAYRIGYARMAADCVTDIGEARRFKGLEMRYANRLRRFQRSA
jgi:hypothetical protein